MTVAAVYNGKNASEFISVVNAGLGSRYIASIFEAESGKRIWGELPAEYYIPLGQSRMRVKSSCGGSPLKVASAGDVANIRRDVDITFRFDGSLSVLKLALRKSDIFYPEVTRACDQQDERGGCCPQAGGYRRRLITNDSGRGVRQLNYNVVHMESKHTETHVHPVTLGVPQNEIYVVLHPKDCGRKIAGAYAPKILVCPGTEEADLKSWELLELQPGNLVFIPAGLPHRGATVQNRSATPSR